MSPCPSKTLMMYVIDTDLTPFKVCGSFPILQVQYFPLQSSLQCHISEIRINTIIPWRKETFDLPVLLPGICDLIHGAKTGGMLEGGWSN